MARIVVFKDNKLNKKGHAQAMTADGSKVHKTHQIAPKDWIASGHRVRVHSSNVGAIAYDKEAKVLWVEFGNPTAHKAKGLKTKLKVTHYKYFGVHPATAKAMFNSSSMGQFVWKRLRFGYPYDGPFPGRIPDFVSEIEVEVDE